MPGCCSSSHKPQQAAAEHRARCSPCEREALALGSSERGQDPAPGFEFTMSRVSITHSPVPTQPSMLLPPSSPHGRGAEGPWSNTPCEVRGKLRERQSSELCRAHPGTPVAMGRADPALVPRSLVAMPAHPRTTPSGR